MTSSITAKTCEAWFLLEAADLRGLPAPFDVSVTEGQTRLGLRSVDDLRAWADALNTDVPAPRERAGRYHWNVEGKLHDLPVSLFVVTTLAEVSA